MVNALILAGDSYENGNPKALLQIASRNMIEYLIDSLRNCSLVNKIYIVANDMVKEKIGCQVDGYIKPVGSIFENLKTGIKEIGEYDIPYIICTSDIPMVNSDAISDFVEKCEEKKIDMGYPIIDKKLNDEKYPEVKRTYVKIKEGTFTGGNIIYIDPKVVEKCSQKAEQLVKYRKHPFMMGKVMGFTFLIRLALGMLSISTAEKKFEKIFNFKGVAILTNYPEIGNDVDKPSDVDFVNKYIGKSA